MTQLIETLRGFSFNGVHNTEKGVVMHSKVIQSPSKKKIKTSVPFMNSEYDFSTVATNGEITYNNREITVVIGIPSESKERLQIEYSKMLTWLVDVNKSRLIFDDIPDYYFMAEVESATTLEQLMEFGRLTVTFTAEPFKNSIQYIGSELWDTFNFEEDYMEDVEFDVSGSKTVTLYNPGRLIVPVINSSAVMKAKVNGYTANLIEGNNKDLKFKLKKGSNSIIITGYGHVEFIFRKEIL